MKKRVNMKLIPIRLSSVNYLFLMQGTTVNKDIPINKASGVGYTVDIQTTHYSSEGEDKRIYTFCITI